MNTLELVDYVRELGSLPDGRFSDSQIIGLADGEITDLYMQILSVRSDYMVETVPMSGTSFRIPPRAIGQKVRNIVAKLGTKYINIARINQDDLPVEAMGYYYKNNTVFFNKVHDQLPGVTFDVSYYARPGTLVSISSSARCIAASSTGSVWSGAPLTGSAYDVVKGTSGFETLSASLAVSASVSGASWPYTSTVATVIPGLEVADWLSAPNTSPVPQLPDEFHTVLATVTISRCLDSIGDNEGFARAKNQAKQQLDTAIATIAERDDGSPEKLRLETFSPWVYTRRNY